MAFDLDDDELEATRKIHKGSDINVGSIEEDIKILKSIIKVHNDFFPESNKETINEKEIKALNNLINDYKRQKQINEEHQKINGELREKVKELEEENYLQKVALFEESIPKQKIKDFKEQIKLSSVIVGGRRNGKTLEYGVRLGKIKACEELLKESEE